MTHFIFIFFFIFAFLSVVLSQEHQTIVLSEQQQSIWNDRKTSTNTKTVCVKLEEIASVSYDKKILTIGGNEGQELCTCDESYLSQYRSTIETITFVGSISSIPQRCFANFVSL